MGKNKQNKKKNNAKKQREPREKRLDPSIADEEEEEDYDGSIRSDAATLPSSDDTIAAANAEGNDCEVTIEGVHLNENDGGLKQHMRKRVAWSDLRQWWDGECAPFVRILNDLVYDMSRAGTEGVITAYEILQSEEEQAYQAMKDNMAETAKAYGVQPLPDKLDRERRNVNYPGFRTYTEEELKDLIMKWKLTQSSYLPSGKFINLQVGRWGSLLEAQRYTHKYNHYAKKDSHHCVANDQAECGVKSPTPQQQQQLQQLRQLQPVQQHPGPAPPPSNLPALAPLSRPRNMDEYIRVNLFSPDGLTTIVSLKWSTRMIKLKEKHSQRLGKNAKLLVYRYKGKNLRDSDTVKSLGMVDNDIIHVIEAPRRH
ncbi:hypothetical protein PFISCL1PPCAC_7628 [Pristionchus fissidentatus]|uniref:Ubiquitin-like domain-containing protein n=1 Tax=Pristionchus fissidentatus TaxID=1538716 RepID=A0AAV5VAF6_9BILA|nr:hypothetical protein PFISCL1PPCAC_7628 [Pristionchus fissidentatus]